jgi:hypothetical protein
MTKAIYITVLIPIHLNIYITYLQSLYCYQKYWIVKVVCHNV